MSKSRSVAPKEKLLPEQLRRARKIQLQAQIDPLQAELDEIVQDEAVARQAAEYVRGQQLLDNIGLLLRLQSAHTEQDCSDDRIINEGLCGRCALLSIQRDEYIEWPFDKLDVQLKFFFR